MTYVIAQPCVDVLDKACIEECPVDCIYEGERMLYIHPDECVDCGACEPVCPVEAIFYEDDLPEQWKDFYKANVEFFEDLGSPGGASKVGKINKDHPIVAALPPQAEADAAEGHSSAACVPGPAPSGTGRCRTSRGIGSRRTSGRRSPTRTASSTSRSAPPSTRCPPSCGRRWRSVRQPRLPDDARHRGAPRGRGRLAAPPPRRARRPRGRAAHDRLQGAGRLAADAARGRPGDRVVVPRARLPHL